MFGLKPPLYYLPGKRAVRLPGPARRRRARNPPPSPRAPSFPGRTPAPAGPGRTGVRGGAGTRLRCPARSGPGCALRARGARRVRVSLLLSARSRLCGSASRERGPGFAPRGASAPGVKLLSRGPGSAAAPQPRPLRARPPRWPRRAAPSCGIPWKVLFCRGREGGRLRGHRAASCFLRLAAR